MKIKYFYKVIAFLIFVMAVVAGQQGNKKMNYYKLTDEEERVIIHKGTEPPFSGKYLNNKQVGIYVCKRCGTPLYRSSDKFDSECGWPAFDDEIKGAVKRVLDADGVRTEIICANCGAHLGHVFTGEGLTKKNIRHCVNSISLQFIPAAEIKAKEKQPQIQKAYFAGGCFWGVDYWFKTVTGVISVRSGFMGGKTKHPTYEQVCSGKTGHAEIVEVTYDPEKVSYEQLAKLFFEIHDPTQKNRQGPDVGYQYRSAIFYTDNQQKETAMRLIEQLQKNGLNVVTKLESAKEFWQAEDYHQDYYQKNGGRPYCHIKTKRF